MGFGLCSEQPVSFYTRPSWIWANIWSAVKRDDQITCKQGPMGDASHKVVHPWHTIYHQQHLHTPRLAEKGDQEDFPRQIKKRKASIQDPALDLHFSNQDPDSVEESPQYPSTNMLAIDIGDIEKVLKYYENALNEFQQLKCRVIAKTPIKCVEPRRQAHFPYNGGRTASSQKRDPEETKPVWCPPA